MQSCARSRSTICSGHCSQSCRWGEVGSIVPKAMQKFDRAPPNFPQHGQARLRRQCAGCRTLRVLQLNSTRRRAVSMFLSCTFLLPAAKNVVFLTGLVGAFCRAARMKQPSARIKTLIGCPLKMSWAVGRSYVTLLQPYSADCRRAGTNPATLSHLTCPRSFHFQRAAPAFFCEDRNRYTIKNIMEEGAVPSGNFAYRVVRPILRMHTCT
jgi:hypothetical protein